MNEISVLNNLLSQDNSEHIVFHDDVADLIFIDLENEQTKLYNESMGVFDKTHTSYKEFSTDYPHLVGEEPSLIKPYLPVTKCKAEDVSLPLHYGITYDNFTDEQRYLYLKFLENPYKNANIAYVFLFFYSLERHIMQGNWKKASEVIIKLRKVHKNKTFQYISAKALIMGAIIQNDASYLKDIDDSQMDNDLFMIYKYSFGRPVYARDLLRMADDFKISTNKYYKMDKKLYSQVFSHVFSELVKGNSFTPQQIIKSTDNLPKHKYYFENYSIKIYGHEIEVPQIIKDETFTAFINQIKTSVNKMFDDCLKNLKLKLLTK